MKKNVMEEWFDNALINKMFSKNTEEFWDYYSNTWYVKYCEKENQLIPTYVILKSKLQLLQDHERFLEFFKEDGESFKKIPKTSWEEKMPKDLEKIHKEAVDLSWKFDGIKTDLSNTANRFNTIMHTLYSATSGATKGRVFDNFCETAVLCNNDWNKLKDEINFMIGLKDYNKIIKYYEEIQKREAV